MNAPSTLKRLNSEKNSHAVEVSTTQYLMFNLGDDTYATPIQDIREIIEFVNMTKIPLTPDFLRGVINLRGVIVPVLDLAVRFGRPKTVIGRRTCIVIIDVVIEDSNHLMGIIVDSVTEVMEVEHSKVGTPPDFGLGLRSDFIAGMINKDENFIVVLDMNNILSVDELEQLVALQQQQSALNASARESISIANE